MHPLHARVGQTYSRKALFAALGLEPPPVGGNWFTGYHTFEGAHFIFCNVGIRGRTGHQYNNRWEEPDRLRWFGKTHSAATQPQISAMTSGVDPVYLFHRDNNRDEFTFGGQVRAIQVIESQPVEILWELLSADDSGTFPEEISPAETLREGATHQILVNAYERNAVARRKCIEYYGTRCVVCGFSFEDRYGELGRGFIHVHHLRRLAEIGKDYRVDPVTDLRPVCPNCHAMLHRNPDPPGLDELRLRLTVR